MVLIIVCIITVKSIVFYKVFKVKHEKLFVMGKFFGLNLKNLSNNYFDFYLNDKGMYLIKYISCRKINLTQQFAMLKALRTALLFGKICSCIVDNHEEYRI